MTIRHCWFNRTGLTPRNNKSKPKAVKQKIIHASQCGPLKYDQFSLKYLQGKTIALEWGQDMNYCVINGRIITSSDFSNSVLHTYIENSALSPTDRYNDILYVCMLLSKSFDQHLYHLYWQSMHILVKDCMIQLISHWFYILGLFTFRIYRTCFMFWFSLVFSSFWNILTMGPMSTHEPC